MIQGALKHYGSSHAIVYGVIPAAAPLIIVGTTVLGVAASKADWPQFGTALVVITAGIVALFVGPSAAWLVAGIGLFLAIVGHSIATAMLRFEHRGALGFLAAVGDSRMTTEALDPVIHAPARLRIVTTLAALPDGERVSVGERGQRHDDPQPRGGMDHRVELFGVIRESPTAG